MEFGPEIKLDGQPAWLDDKEIIIPQWYGDHWYHEGCKVKHANHAALTAIRLPVDHFAYRAIEHGMEPWGGGNEAPADFGGEILFRALGGRPKSADAHMRWTHDGGSGDIIGYRRKSEAAATEEWFIRLNDECGYTAGKAYRRIDNGNVIDDDGADRIFFASDYRPAEPHEVPGYAAPMPEPCPIEAQSNGAPIPGAALMTEAEAEDLLKRYDVTGYRGVDMLRSLGLIAPPPAPPTLLEQFEDHHGGLDDNQRAIIEAYQEWTAGL